MLLAMVDDIRVVLVKLAERTQALRYLMNADERLRQQTAREVQDVFAPLANRLGIWQLKWSSKISPCARSNRPSTRK
jgi:GTP pyrophosphokinase